uniref:MIP18 family-like domain-containing protein n=1 Tax=Aegilops tauschii subsp. strangulata TaxID=200361 RepID=A0A453DW85_AEGTS
VRFGTRRCCSRITFTPTVQQCSMSTVIGLCLRLKLMQNPRDYTTGRRPAPQQADP